VAALAPAIVRGSRSLAVSAGRESLRVAFGQAEADGHLRVGKMGDQLLECLEDLIRFDGCASVELGVSGARAKQISPAHVMMCSDMRKASESEFLEEVRRCCEAARNLSRPEPPSTFARSLDGGSDSVTDWRRILEMLSRDSDLKWRMLRLQERLYEDEDVEEIIGHLVGGGTRAYYLWDSIIGPIVHLYGLRCGYWDWEYPLCWEHGGDWSWDGQLAERCIREWRQSLRPHPVWFRTLVPIDNFRGEGPLVIKEGIMIRRFTDDDRLALWRSVGGTDDASPASPTARQIRCWSHVIDIRWSYPQVETFPGPVTPEAVAPAVEAAEDVVRALRLHDHGVMGATTHWTRVDPPDHVVLCTATRELLGSAGLASSESGVAGEIGPEDESAVRTLFQRLRSARNDKTLALVLRRFDAAYARREDSDSLIDLWVAFEALLIPDGSAELSYRASMRIARLVGTDVEGRKEVFKRARRSYNARSQVVHGTNVSPKDIAEVLDDTRMLARSVIGQWLLEPPPGGVEALDNDMLA
jgi:hypothetical protein